MEFSLCLLELASQLYTGQLRLFYALLFQLAVLGNVVTQTVTVAADCETIFEYFWPGVLDLVTLAMICFVYKYIYFKGCVVI